VAEKIAYSLERRFQTDQMLLETVDVIRKQMRSGKSLDNIKAAGLPAKYEDWGKGFINTPTWIETIYKSLSKSSGN